MAKNNRDTQATPPEAVISIIGKGMTLTGDCETDGAIRIEGTVKGNVRAGKAVVIGKEGLVDGNIYTQDAVISGRVLGSVHAHSRLELQSTSQISGEIEARRMQLEEGATVQGQVAVGEAPAEPQTETKPVVSPRPGSVSEGTPEGGVGGQGVSSGSSSGGVTHGGASVASTSPATSPRVTHPNPQEQRPAQGDSRSTHVQQSPPTTLPS
jgi:cytoskeletal protein CcmA (bactofilin family)